ncbi:MAG: hypothetical protein CVV17_07675, partial [Gammaproteobacteria bacterium HGW-Gammaproteobacteria-7]
LVLGVMTFTMPWQQRRLARSVPPIHDITTDLGDPPTFEAILPLRADAPNPAEYGGEEIAAQQRAAYPDIVPLRLEGPTAAAFTRALEAAREMGWEIIAADSARGRIEAVATTRWFGFIDDVVVRISEDGSRSRIDVRSVSRVGRSDVGANASGGHLGSNMPMGSRKSRLLIVQRQKKVVTPVAYRRACSVPAGWTFSKV